MLIFKGETQDRELDTVHMYHDIFANGTFFLHFTLQIYILLDVLPCSIAEYFYELCRILTSP